MTSDINEVDVFIIIASPIPYNAASGKTTQFLLVSSFKKPSGTEVIIRMTTLIAIGIDLFLSAFVIFYWWNTLNSVEKIYERRGTKANYGGVGLSTPPPSDFPKPQTSCR